LESTKLLIIVLRALSILTIWYLVVIPILSKILKKFVQKSKLKYSKEVDEIINLFPLLKETFIIGWQNSRNERLLNKVKHFLVYLILTILTKE
jgi:VanZ family protein